MASTHRISALYASIYFSYKEMRDEKNQETGVTIVLYMNTRQISCLLDISLYLSFL